jgi:hypothetical protein
MLPFPPSATSLGLLSTECKSNDVLTILQVAFVEPDQMMYASALRTQTGATWGLGLFIYLK